MRRRHQTVRVLCAWPRAVGFNPLAQRFRGIDPVIVISQIRESVGRGKIPLSDVPLESWVLACSKGTLVPLGTRKTMNNRPSGVQRPKSRD